MMSQRNRNHHVQGPSNTAPKVPYGIDFSGSFKSPERLNPVNIPVTAGKIPQRHPKIQLRLWMHIPLEQLGSSHPNLPPTSGTQLTIAP